MHRTWSLFFLVFGTRLRLEVFVVLSLEGGAADYCFFAYCFLGKIGCCLIDCLKSSGFQFPAVSQPDNQRSMHLCVCLCLCLSVSLSFKLSLTLSLSLSLILFVSLCAPSPSAPQRAFIGPAARVRPSQPRRRPPGRRAHPSAPSVGPAARVRRPRVRPSAPSVGPAALCLRVCFKFVSVFESASQAVPVGLCLCLCFCLFLCFCLCLCLCL